MPVARTQRGELGTHQSIQEPKLTEWHFLRGWKESLTVAAVLLFEKAETHPTTQLSSSVPSRDV